MSISARIFVCDVFVLPRIFLILFLCVVVREMFCQAVHFCSRDQTGRLGRICGVGFLVEAGTVCHGFGDVVEAAKKWGLETGAGAAGTGAGATDTGAREADTGAMGEYGSPKWGKLKNQS